MVSVSTGFQKKKKNARNHANCWLEQIQITVSIYTLFPPFLESPGIGKESWKVLEMPGILLKFWKGPGIYLRSNSPKVNTSIFWASSVC